MRINKKEASPHALSYQSDLAPAAMRKHNGDKPIVTPKHKDAALSRMYTNSTTTAPYDGAELRPFDGRPGAMVAFSLPSRGLAT